MTDNSDLSDARKRLRERTPWGKLPYEELLRREIDAFERVERNASGDVRYVHLDAEEVPEILEDLGEYLNYMHARQAIQKRGYRITYKTDNPGHVRFTLKRDEEVVDDFYSLSLHICTQCKAKHAYAALSDEYKDRTEAYCTQCEQDTEMMAGTPGKLDAGTDLPGYTQ